MKRKVAFVVYNLEAGGYQNYLLRFLKIHSLGNNFSIFCKSGQKGPLTSKFQDLNVSVFAQKVGFFNPTAWLKFYKFLKAQKFDTVCDFTGNFGGVIILLCQIAGITNRIVFYRRSSNAFGKNPLKKFFNFFLNKLVYWNATKVLANSQYALDFFHPVHHQKPLKFKVIYNGIDKEDFEIGKGKEEFRRKFGIPVEGFVIGHVGRYNEAKNHETIFKVANIICKKESNVYFAFCGEGTDSKEFQERVEYYGFRTNTCLLGSQSDISAVLHAFDLFYFPSVTESQPNALIEAMVAGLPVLTSDIPPIREIIPEDQGHVLIPPEDAERAAEVLQYLKVNPEARKAYQCKQWATELFDQDKNFAMFEQELLK